MIDFNLFEIYFVHCLYLQLQLKMSKIRLQLHAISQPKLHQKAVKKRKRKNLRKFLKIQNRKIEIQRRKINQNQRGKTRRANLKTKIPKENKAKVRKQAN